MYSGVAKKPANLWPVYGTGLSLDRRNYVTASEVAYCERKVYFDKQELIASDYSPSEGTAQRKSGWGVLERGHNIEAWFIEQLARGLSGAVPLLFAGEYQASFAHKSQSGTPDGAFILGDRFKSLEVKSVDPRTNMGRLPKPEHVKQCIQNCDLLEHALDKDCDGAILVYIDASNYENIYPFDIPFDHDTAAALEARAERIMKAASAADLEPEGVHAGHCGYCRHTAACTALVRSARNPVQEKTTNDLKLAAAGIFGQLQGASKGAR